MKFSIDKRGDLVLTFKSPINLDNGHTNTPLGEMESEMTLYTNSKGVPNKIEWIVGEGYSVESLGLWFDGLELAVYDGVFEIPEEALTLIEKAGYKCTYKTTEA